MQLGNLKSDSGRVVSKWWRSTSPESAQCGRRRGPRRLQHPAELGWPIVQRSAAQLAENRKLLVRDLWVDRIGYPFVQAVLAQIPSLGLCSATLHTVNRTRSLAAITTYL